MQKQGWFSFMDPMNDPVNTRRVNGGRFGKSTSGTPYHVVDYGYNKHAWEPVRGRRPDATSRTVLNHQTGFGDWLKHPSKLHQQFPFLGQHLLPSWAAGHGPKLGFAGKMRASAAQQGRQLWKAGGIYVDVALIPFIATAGAIGGAMEWGAQTGLEEDYVGGGIYGGIKGTASGIGGGAGAFAGAQAGAAAGILFGGAAPVMVPLLATVASIAGYIYGAHYAEAGVEGPARGAGMAARSLVKTARTMDRIQFGGNFADSRGAYTMRQSAVRDMSGSMLNARQYLGNEAIFLHER